jgi:hypothetical protein
VVRLFAEGKARDRQELLRIFQALGQNPFQPGDYVQRTASFRTLQVKRFGKWLVTYWPSHADAELRVMEVKRLVP